LKYGEFGRLDRKVSALGFGSIRLPILDDRNNGRVDKSEAIDMIIYAMPPGGSNTWYLSIL